MSSQHVRLAFSVHPQDQKVGKLTKRNPSRDRHDIYPTPIKAVEPAWRWMREDGFDFAEPCAGEGKLVRHLESFDFKCLYQGDISGGHDALKWVCPPEIEFICTNPPWDRKPMHALIDHFVQSWKPVWLLLDADWMHTKQAAPLMDFWCTHIISIGRVRWIEGSTMDGYDNAAWYRFRKSKDVRHPIFVPRSTNEPWQIG
jgi:hypothetical protein